MSKINLFDIGLSEEYMQEAKLIGGSFHLARVSIQHKGAYRVMTEDGEIQAEVSGKLIFSADVSADYPAVGDWVLVDKTDDANGSAIIHRILPRKSCFERRAAGSKMERQIIAANIDTVFICMSLNNDFNIRRLERYLSIAWDSSSLPVVVLTKSDLCSNIGVKLAEIGAAAPGVDVLVTSSMSGDGFASILRFLKKGQTIAFIGSSGVGKSTLINKLLGREVLATNGLRDDDRGRHTTSFRQLLVLPQGGVIIDTPGMRELQLAGGDLSMSFSDIEELAQGCYFKDCRHESEPKCAVRQGIEEGILSPERLESYKKLQREMVFEERKGTMSAAQAEKQKVIEMMGSLDACKQLLKINRKNKGKS